MSPELLKLHDGLIRAVIMAVRAWQDWIKAQRSAATQETQEQDAQKSTLQ